MNLGGLVNKTNEERAREITERVQDNTKALEGMSTPFERRVEHDRIQVQDRSVPHLTNLNEDE